MNPSSSSRFLFNHIPGAFLRPAQTFATLAESGRSVWLTPMLVLSLTLVVRLLVSGYFQGQAAAMGEVPLPPDWQWWTPDMQSQYMQAQSLTQGPTFLYVIPIATGLAGLWAGWGAVSGILHLISTLLGGRGSMNTALNGVAWASLPFALRDILRIVFMFSAGRTIASPGFSGYLDLSLEGMAFWAQLLANLDIFVLWHLVLMAIGLSVNDSLSRGKAAMGAVAVLLVALFAQAGIGYGISLLSGLVVTRPF